MPTIQKSTSSPPPSLTADELLQVENALPALTATQDEMASAVMAHFKQDGYVLTESERETGSSGKLQDVEKYWLSYECILRYLRATKWTSAQAAIKRLESTLL